MQRYLQATELVDYHHPSIQAIIADRNWRNLNDYEKIHQIYEYVRNDITFGYNRADNIPASEVLKDGYGQCNTKSILLMALLRGSGVPCRIHGFYIDKKMQKGALTGIAYLFAPRKIVHAWTEVRFNGEWQALEGVIIDDAYLHQVTPNLCSVNGGFIGYGIAVPDRNEINLCWQGASTYVQSFSITDDMGYYDNPDDFFARHNNMTGFIKSRLFNRLRHKINARLQHIRDGE